MFLLRSSFIGIYIYYCKEKRKKHLFLTSKFTFTLFLVIIIFSLLRGGMLTAFCLLPTLFRFCCGKPKHAGSASDQTMMFQCKSNENSAVLTTLVATPFCLFLCSSKTILYCFTIFLMWI